MKDVATISYIHSDKSHLLYFFSTSNPTKTSILREQMIANASRPKHVQILDLDSESPSKRRKKPLELQIKENQIEHQKLVIESQRSKLKKQQREIEDLKKMTNQIDKGECLLLSKHK